MHDSYKHRQAYSGVEKLLITYMYVLSYISVVLRIQSKMYPGKSKNVAFKYIKKKEKLNVLSGAITFVSRSKEMASWQDS